jgi:ferredoxin-like protein FixX
MYVRYILALTRNHFFHGNERIDSHFIVVGVDVAVKNKKNYSVLPWKCNNGFLFHCCPATMYFVLLLKTISIKYSVCVSVFLP